MAQTTRVDFHCHSAYSDGALTPREVAEQLAADGVLFAALTDHDCVEGLAEFREAASRRGIGTISGVEITAEHEGEEIHVLGYGFDPEHEELRRTLRSLRLNRPPGGQSVVGAVRSRTSIRAPRRGQHPHGASRNGRISLKDAIELIHRAGGQAFLAHPLVVRRDIEQLRGLVNGLKQHGLDGIEVYYGPHSPAQREALEGIARTSGLLASAGSDMHDRPNGRAGVEMPTEAWKRFRDKVGRGPAAGQSGIVAAAEIRHRHRIRRRHFLFHVVFPTVLAIGLFVGAIFGVFLPAFEHSLLERKREMIRQLTEAAWSILASYHEDEQAGLLSRERAQELAAASIEQLRYGPQRKDYFWLQDMTPRIIMHPYRPDLEGQDVSEFTDTRGVRIFERFADVVRRRGEGYVDYVWQWKDDPERLAPKQSYVKGFEPWGWIIGTGLYTEDVQAEIAQVERRLIYASLGIIALVAVLLAWVMRESLQIERERWEAEESLRESTERYRSLVEAATEGTLLVIEGRCRYANPIMLEIIGASEAELEMLDLEDVVPRVEGNESAWEQIERIREGEEPVGGFDGLLRRRDGRLIESVFALSPISFAGREGLILLATPIGPSTDVAGAGAGVSEERLLLLGEVADTAPVGVFRARATAQGTVVECSRTAAPILRQAMENPEAPLTMSGLFRDPDSWQEFLAEIRREGSTERTIHVPCESTRTMVLEVKASLAGDERGEGRFVDGIIEDVTARERLVSERAVLLERLQSSMLFLHEPVSKFMDPPVYCGLREPVRSVVASMNADDASSALVRAESGEVIGIFTDRDLRRRVMAAGLGPETPIHRVMSSPLVTIDEHGEVFEALLTMEREDVGHVVVVDHAGEIVGLVRHRELLQFPNYGPIVLARTIERAGGAEEAISAAQRAPALARALVDGGAHPQQVTRVLTSACDAAAERFVAFAQERLGPPPAAFALVGLGSHGREELVLSSDQDNAIIYADDAANEDVAAYFVGVGELVNEWLDEAGWPLCRGDVMARNPRWCRPLSDWRGYFSEWIQRAEPAQLLEFSIFFDFRLVHGEARLVTELREDVYRQVRAHPSFLPHLAQNALAFKPPVRLFGRIIVGGSGGDHQGMLNLKEALAPIVQFARLYALREGVEATHTLDRLRDLVEAGALSEGSYEDTANAWEMLQRIRLRHHSQALERGDSPDNLVAYRSLPPLEQTMVNQALSQIAAVQERIRHDFFGGAT